MTLRRPLICTSLALAAAVSTPAVAADSIFGRWLTDDGNGIVRIERCGKAACGRIERVLTPKAAETDVNNPDPELRSRRIVGLRVLSGFVGDGSRWENGRAYDPKTGRSYDATLKLQDGGKLKVTGCVLIFCRSKYWTRAP